MPRHALRSELAAKLSDGWTGAAGRHVLDTEMPSPTGVAGRQALDSEVQAIVVGPVAPTFHGIAQNRGFSTTNTIGAVTGAQAGDLLVAFAAGNDQTQTLTPPAGEGWTVIGDNGSATAAARLRVLVTTATAANQAGGTWTWTATAHNHSIAILAYGHVTAPATASMVRNNAQPTITVPSLTTTGANAILLTYAFYTSNGTAPAWPVSMTVRSPSLAASASGLGADEVRATAGATGTRTLTAGASPAFFTAAGLVLNP